MITRASPSIPHLNPTTSQRSYLLLSSHWRLGHQHMNLAGAGVHRHLVYNKLFTTVWISLNPFSSCDLYGGIFLYSFPFRCCFRCSKTKNLVISLDIFLWTWKVKVKIWAQFAILKTETGFFGLCTSIMCFKKRSKMNFKRNLKLFLWCLSLCTFYAYWLPLFILRQRNIKYYFIQCSICVSS